MSSSASYVNNNGGLEKLIGRPRRFYIDDILASDFGRRCFEERRSVGSEFNQDQSTVADTAAANRRDHPNIAGSTIPLKNDTAPQLDQSAGGRSKVSTSRSQTYSLTSSRHFRDNETSTDSSSSSTGDSRRTALKDVVKVEPCSSRDPASKIGDVLLSSTCVSNAKPAWNSDGKDCFTLPAWVYCTRYSDRPSAGPRIRRRPACGGSARRGRRRRTAFSADQLQQLRDEYDRCRYLSDESRRQLADRLGLHVGTVKIWFQNRRASDKKASGVRNGLALRLMAEGLYDHHTVDCVTTPTLR